MHMLKIALILHLTFSLIERTLSLQTQHKLSVSAGFRSRVWECSKTFSVSHVHVTDVRQWDKMKPDHRFHIAHVERCTCLHSASRGLYGILYIDTISGMEPKSWLKYTDSPPGVTEINPMDCKWPCRYCGMFLVVSVGCCCKKGNLLTNPQAYLSLCLFYLQGSKRPSKLWTQSV